jgi:hypothetical protein
LMTKVNENFTKSGTNRCNPLAMVEPTQRGAKTIDSCKGMTLCCFYQML